MSGLKVEVQLGRQIRYQPTHWSWICVDAGAERTVVGLNQAWAYSLYARLPWIHRTSAGVFRFRDNWAKSQGIMEICVSVPGHRFLILEGHVVQADLPLLMGLDVLCAFGLTLNFRADCIMSFDPP